MPPARSGIADYSAALLEHLQHICRVTVFSSRPETFDPNDFDVLLYQIGNNADHDFVYETALRFPGVVVLHEANLHHLVADISIRRGDWDGYIRECAFEGGEPARIFAERVRALETGPDYEGLAMLRRIVEAARAFITHSEYVLQLVREAGFGGPAAVIPHGAWIEQPLETNGYTHTRQSVRSGLGLDERNTLIGTFGYLKPYKRIAQTLRAFRRLVRLDSRVRLILGGETHPEFPIEQIVQSLGLQAHVRVLGYTPIEDFSAYIAASDIVVNLRYPTVGETSGSLLRAFSAGRATLVSGVGAFAELPDDVCLKVPVTEGEEELIFEYLNLLTTQPDLRIEIGARARKWVERECGWRTVAKRYLEFLTAVSRGEAAERHEPAVEPPASGSAAVPVVDAEYLRNWAIDPTAKDYFDDHAARFKRTLEITPMGDASKSVLEMGAYMQITPALHFQLGYGTVRGCYYGRLGRTDRKYATSYQGESFECLIDHFDAEKDRYPYDDEFFDTVLCCELIEHLFADPMHMMCEVNRILKPGGAFVITTPNIVSLRAVGAIFESYNPGFFTAYLKPNPSGDTEARHNREYTPNEIHRLLLGSGFELTVLETGPFRDAPHPEFPWIEAVLRKLFLQTQWRGDGIYAVGRKTGPVTERWPAWLYV